LIGFTERLVRRDGVTALLVITFFLLTSVINPMLVSSEQLSTSYQDDSEKIKSQEHKINGIKPSRDPFKFPMPLGGLGTNGPDATEAHLQGNNQPNHDESSSTDEPTKHSTFKATLIAEKKVIKNTTEKAIKPSSYAISTKSDTISKNTSALNKKGNLLKSDNNNNTSRIYRLDFNSKTIPIEYQITGRSNEVLNISLKNNNPSLLIDLSAGSAGTIQVELARNMIDSKNQDMHTDTPFAVFEDGLYSSFYETKNNNDLRQLMIGFNKGTAQISIVGTHASPEYGSTATVLYGISMTVIIILTLVSRYNWVSLGTFVRGLLLVFVLLRRKCY
jgi:hypothetical protein